MYIYVEEIHMCFVVGQCIDRPPLGGRCDGNVGSHRAKKARAYVRGCLLAKVKEGVHVIQFDRCMFLRMS